MNYNFSKSITFSGRTALTVKLDFLVEGALTLNGAPEIPLGVTNPLVRDDETRLLLSWLVMADAVAVAIITIDFSLSLSTQKKPKPTRFREEYNKRKCSF